MKRDHCPPSPAPATTRPGSRGPGRTGLLCLAALAALAVPEAARAKPLAEPELARAEWAGGVAEKPDREQRAVRRRLRGETRSIDGSGNNREHPEMGAADTPLLRIVAPDYPDGMGEMAGDARPGPREISNAVHAQSVDRKNAHSASDLLWQWGQFVDHDLDLSETMDPPESAPIPVPMGDPEFDPMHTGTAVIPFDRSFYAPGTGHHPAAPREQMNAITSWIDASNVYGSDEERAAALRLHDGSGMLKTSNGDLLPFNEAGLPNAGGASPALFLAGDVRANEQLGLTAMHTLFVREHNRLARRLRRRNARLSGDEIYARVRRLVIAEMQVITYEEYLPALLGREAIPPYTGYEPRLDARIANLFSTAAYRYGHSALNPRLLRLDADGDEIAEGHLALREAFFAPWRIAQEGGIEPILRGLCAQRAQSIDPYIIDDVRNFLFGPPGAGGLDLAALNIQRGRDHGLPGYNDVREALGLGRAASIEEITSDPEIRARLASVYAHVDLVDVWVGALAEDPAPGALVGELVHQVVRDQFLALRDGDRFWYQRVLTPRQRRWVERTRLSTIIRRNTKIGEEIPDDVFYATN